MSPDESVAAALSDHVTPLSAVSPSDESDDLRSLAAQFETADVVGLGEPTHGTREAFGVKHRLIRFLVTACGYRTIALETDFANTLAVNEFVRDGGDARTALDDILLWVWKTDGMAATLQLLRAFNDGRSPDDQVRFYGVSVSDPSRPADALRASLRAVGSDGVVPDSLARVADGEIPGDDETAQMAFLDAGIDAAERARNHLERNREQYLTASSADEFHVTRHLCRHLEQSCEWNRLRLSTPGQFDPEAFEQRDRYMAENVGWCLDNDPGDGVVLSAHNTHVKRGSFDMDYEWAQGATMGEFLDREFGSRYRPLGMDFARGEFRAIPDVDDPEKRVPRTFPVASPGERSVAAHLDRLGQSPLFLDVSAASDDDRLDSWFDDERRIRGVSALVDSDAETRVHDIETNLTEAFDGLVFVAETTPSVPLDDT